MTPIPVAASFEALNAMLAERCRLRQDERAGRHAQTIGERLVADLTALRDLPSVPLEPCEKRGGRVSSTALVATAPTTTPCRRLLEALPRDIVTFAVTEAIRRGAIGFDAVKLIALARIERRPARLDLSAYPHLLKTTVRTTSAADYAVLLPEEAARAASPMSRWRLNATICKGPRSGPFAYRPQTPPLACFQLRPDGLESDRR